MLSVSSESVFNSAYRWQLLATLAVNLLGFSHGIGLGWIPPTLAKLQCDDSPIGVVLTVEEVSWIGSMISAGGLTGNLLFGLLLNRIGRKKTLLLLPFAHFVFWTLSFFATQGFHLYIARFIAGTCGGGLFASVPIYVAEIADNKIRGTLGSLFLLILNTGTMVGLILGSYLDYKVTPCIVLVLPLLYLLTVIYLPDTPQYLILIGDDTGAIKSLEFYKNANSSKDADVIKKMNADFNDLKFALKSSTQNADEEKLKVKDFCTPQAISAILITLGLLVMYNFSGIFAIMSYSTDIFIESGTEIDPNVSTILLGLVQIAGIYTATVLIDRIGRKILVVVSSFGSCVGLIVSACYSYYSLEYDLSALNWIPVAALAFVVFISNAGIMSVIFVVSVELLPSKIRTQSTAVCLCLSCFMSFVILKIFPGMMVAIGFYGVMFFCAAVCGFGTLFVLMFVPETKGISLDKKSVES